MSSNPKTLEGMAVSLADRIAYINHDIDDAIAGGFITLNDLPKDSVEVLGTSSSQRINTMIYSIFKASDNQPYVKMEDEIYTATNNLRSFLFERVYNDKTFKIEEEKAERMISALYDYYKKNIGELPEFNIKQLEKEDLDTVVSDYISSMSDSYVVKVFTKLFVPNKWES
jgi:dGTPase